jgi:hypothetical protein
LPTLECLKGALLSKLPLAGIGLPAGSAYDRALSVRLEATPVASIIQIGFLRAVSWILPSGKTVEYVVPIWTTRSLAYGSNRAIFLSGIDDAMDKFLNAYLKANQVSGQ